MVKDASPVATRFGYLVAAVVDLLLLSLINRSPGWRAVPFLTQDTPRVLGLVNASLVAGVVANSIYLMADPRWLRAVGDIVTTSIGLAALVQCWVVFPIAVGAVGAVGGVDWELVARWVIGVGIGGSIIAIVVGLARLGRSLAVPHCATHGPAAPHG